MNLIPWRNKQPEVPAVSMSPLVALRGEMDRLFDSFFREPFGGIRTGPGRHATTGRRPSTLPRARRN